MLTCLVTGGCGFIGSHLVEALVAKGHPVRVLDDLSTGRLENLRAVRRCVDFWRGSVADPDVVRAAVQGVQWVFHLAALPSVQRSLESPLATHAACATGTLHVLEAARQARVRRVIYAASSSAYGDAAGAVRRENVCASPLSPYAAAKLAGEHYCRSYSRAFGLETVRLRFFNVFGPRQRADSLYTGVIPLFIAALCQGRPPVIHGDGSQSRDFTYVDDAVGALLQATETPAAVGNVYNIGAGGRASVLEVLHLLGGLLGCEVEPVYLPPRPGDVRHSQADIGQARRDLGYEPRVPLVEGLRRTIVPFQSGHTGCGCGAEEAAG